MIVLRINCTQPAPPHPDHRPIRRRRGTAAHYSVPGRVSRLLLLVRREGGSEGEGRIGWGGGGGEGGGRRGA